MVSMLTQCYYIPSDCIRNQFVGIISVEIDGIWNHQWNAERVIFFRQLFCSMSVGCPGKETYATGLNHDLNCRKKVPMMSWYRINTGRRKSI